MKLRHVIKGKICKKEKNSMYKMKFQNPLTNLVASKWISVEDIANLQQKHSYKGRIFRKMFLVPLSNEQKLIRPGFDITFNQPPDGNCHFSAIVYHLQSIRIYCSAETFRHEVISYLITILPLVEQTLFLTFWVRFGRITYMKCKGTVHSVMKQHYVVCQRYSILNSK